MQVIYKYELEAPEYPSNVTTAQMHHGAQILHADAVGERLFVWARVPNRDAPLKPRRFVVVGTGHEFDYQGQRHLGTALMQGGALVWHVFEAAF